jgi:hypothetical protein
MRGLKRGAMAVLMAAGMLAATGGTPAAATPTATAEVAQTLAPGTYEVRDSSGKLVGYLVVGSDGSARLYAIREIRQA